VDALSPNDDGDDGDDGDRGSDEADVFDALGSQPRAARRAADRRRPRKDRPRLGDDGEVDVAWVSAGPDDNDAFGLAADGGDDFGAGMLAMFDAELDPGDPVAGMDAGAAAAEAGATETYEQWMRHQRPSAWGRLDVGVALRRRWSEPMHAPANTYNEIWLVAT